MLTAAIGLAEKTDRSCKMRGAPRFAGCGSRLKDLGIRAFRERLMNVVLGSDRDGANGSSALSMTDSDRPHRHHTQGAPSGAAAAHLNRGSEPTVSASNDSARQHESISGPSFQRRLTPPRVR